MQNTQNGSAGILVYTSVLLAALLTALPAAGNQGELKATAAPTALQVFIRAGEKTHGPGQHDHPLFLREWIKLLNTRGAKATGGMTFPSSEQLAATDVLVMYAAEAGAIAGNDRSNLDSFLKRGGGIVVIHDAITGDDPQWFKTVVGGSWEHGKAKWSEGEVHLYFQSNDHPITRDAGNFHLDDEAYFDLHLLPEATVLASSFNTIYKIEPQMWTYEKDLGGGAGSYRAFVSIPGHNHATFGLAHYRALLLRGIAWTGKRDADLLITSEEKEALRYPPGGPTAPRKAAESIAVQDGFDLKLVGAEPLVVKPISLDWDAAGRMWVAETPDYPFKSDPVARGRGRISILLDQNGDGFCDGKKVFADGLELVTSLVFHKDGVIVAQAPHILFLRDTDADGVCDQREVLYTGFGTRDTHAVVSNLVGGQDGWIYGTVGYSGGKITSGDGAKAFGALREGVFRFQPDGSAFEVVSNKSSNTWGVDVAPDGEIFFSQANGSHINHVVIPERLLGAAGITSVTSYHAIADHKEVVAPQHADQPYTQIDFVGQFTAASGCTIYNGGAWPADFDYTHFVSEPTLHVLHQDALKPDGVTFVASKPHKEEFLLGGDLWFRPIHTRVGPDGALYMLDFYNQAVVHNDPRGPRHGTNNAAVRPDRDHVHGRVWRIQHKQAKQWKRLDLSRAAAADLVKALNHSNGWTRATARRLLIEKQDASATDGLKRLLASDAPPAARVDALWTLHGLQALDTETLARATADKDPAVRKASLRAMAEQRIPNDAALVAALRERLADADARVRLAALVALASSPAPASLTADVVAAFPGMADKWTQAAAMAVAGGAPADSIAAALRSNDTTGLLPLVAYLAERLVTHGGDNAAARLVASISQPGTPDASKAVVLERLGAALSKADPLSSPVWSADLQRSFRTLLRSGSDPVAAAALPLVARWDADGAMRADVAETLKGMKTRLADSKQTDDDRARLAINLLAMRKIDPDAAATVGRILPGTASPALKRKLVEALAETGDDAAAAQIIAGFRRLDADVQQVALGALVERPKWTTMLLDAIRQERIRLSTLGPTFIHRLRSHRDPAVARAAAQVIDAIQGPEIKAKDELIASLRAQVLKPGNVVKGKAVFTQNCAVCHAFKGEGRALAPDLTGMGLHGAADLLVHILDPNRVVEANFVSYDVETKDGKTVSGVISRENEAGIVLRNALGDVEVKRADVRSRRTSGASLMPTGFESLGAEALRDVLAYLCADPSRYRLIDLSAAFTADSTRGIFMGEAVKDASLLFTKFGLLSAGDVPFDVIHPDRTASHKNLVVLKGGMESQPRAYPQRVEVPVGNGLVATKLHLLSGVGGWAYPWGDARGHNIPVLKVTVQFAGGGSEEFILHNGREFVDYIAATDVPGSKAVAGVVRRGQVRQIELKLQEKGKPIVKIVLESFNNQVAPVIVAMTAELPEAAPAAGH